MYGACPDELMPAFSERWQAFILKHGLNGDGLLEMFEHQVFWNHEFLWLTPIFKRSYLVHYWFGDYVRTTPERAFHPVGQFLSGRPP